MTLPTRILGIVSVAFLAAYIYLIVEEGRELQVWEKAPNTLSLYSTAEVCVEHDESSVNDDGSTRRTMTRSEEGRSENSHILNCGHCGKCSNRQDINIYNLTRETLTGITTDCVKGGLFRCRNTDYIKQCFQEQSQLTAPCVDCWMLNVDCNWKYCFNTCVKQKVRPFRWLPSLYRRKHDSPMDPCLECDERMCGPPFIECAGANRRRVGVVSDIQRNVELEVCKKVDWDYILESAQAPIQEEMDKQEGSNEL